MSNSQGTIKPDLAMLRAGMMSELTQHQRQLVCAWLCLESVERGSDDIFKLGKSLIHIDDLVSRYQRIGGMPNV